MDRRPLRRHHRRGRLAGHANWLDTVSFQKKWLFLRPRLWQFEI